MSLNCSFFFIYMQNWTKLPCFCSKSHSIYCTALFGPKIRKSKIVVKINFIGLIFPFGIYIFQESWILLISWKTRRRNAVLILTALISLFCRINKLGWWNNILFNLCSITYLYKLLNLNYNHFGQNTTHFKIICFFWSVKSGLTISWKTRMISNSFYISKNKTPRKFWICGLERGYP